MKHRDAAELGVTWDEFVALQAAPDDGTGAALLEAARTFLTPGEFEELLRLHRAGTPIQVRAHHRVEGPRLVVACS